MRQSYHHLKATIRIGKQGITQQVIDEISHQLDQHGVVKVKMLASFNEGEDKKELARKLASQTGAVLVHHVGGVVVLQKKGVIIKPYKKTR